MEVTWPPYLYALSRCGQPLMQTDWTILLTHFLSPFHWRVYQQLQPESFLPIIWAKTLQLRLTGCRKMDSPALTIWTKIEVHVLQYRGDFGGQPYVLYDVHLLVHRLAAGEPGGRRGEGVMAPPRQGNEVTWADTSTSVVTESLVRMGSITVTKGSEGYAARSFTQRSRTWWEMKEDFLHIILDPHMHTTHRICS